MRVLVACEFSGTVRDSFSVLGHDAWSCDLLPTESPGQHYQCDVREVLGLGWDIMIAHPPCTHLAVSGARWFDAKRAQSEFPWEGGGDPQSRALELVLALMQAPIERIAVENPVSIISSKIRKPDQVVQPWQFGDGETKATCLWLKNLPPLAPTDVVAGRSNRIHMMAPSSDRWRERSRTYSGIAAAMAMQWGGPVRQAVAR